MRARRERYKATRMRENKTMAPSRSFPLDIYIIPYSEEKYKV
jgi:hypothetical protein|nr:MAG TPA_asm: hypothetical protein [Caudoviricetes sp.]